MDYNEHTIFIHYLNKDGTLKEQEIRVCKNYLTNMAKHIISVWEIMKKEFK